MLAAHPRKLPEVYAVDGSNVDEVAELSAEFRKKVFLRSRHRARQLTRIDF